MTFCACNKSEIIENKEAASFVASFDANTKTTLNNNLSQSWLGGEVVKVLDVTNAFLATPIETSCTFTNVYATKSTKATFVADDPSFEFIEGHNYIVYYAGTNSTTLKREGATRYMSIKFKSDFKYNPLGKYGLPDNQIPLISKFKYSGKASVQNILFHNITNLLVIRVKNNTSESKQVGYIKIEQSKKHYTVNMFGGALIPYTNTDDYSLPGTSYDFWGGSSASGLGQIIFDSPITIASGETKDFAVFIMRPDSGTFDLTTQIFDKNNGNKIAEAVKSGLSKTNFVGPGRTLVWSIDITSSKATNSLHINPLDNNELAF